jgi:hypothetical protein
MIEKARRDGGPFLGRTRLRAADNSPTRRTIPPARRWGSREGTTMGKFFLFIVAVSIAILLAMSVYIISL